MALVRQGEHEKWYYVSLFKMMLYDEQGLTRDVKLEDDTHKKLSAMTVFSLAIRYLKDEVLKTKRDRLTKEMLQEDEIMWVVTVPAIWNDSAKQFMREAAVEAGITNQKLKIALEPEAALIFCRLLPVEQMAKESEIVCFKAGSKYMILDAGGGTVDLTVHEVMSELKELHKASGGAWGGTQVDETFKQFIISLVGNPVFQRFCQECKEDYLDMISDFEIKKRGIAPNKNADVTIRLSSTLKDIFEDETGEDFLKAITQTKYAEELILVGNKLRVKASVMKNLFSKTIDGIILHVNELLNDSRVRQICGILMVGGFSDSEMLQDAIKSHFPNISVIIPQDAGLVVLKGAVIFGRSPNSITHRVCKYTYGIMTNKPFKKTKHDTTKKIIIEGRPFCHGVFSKHVEMVQRVALNEATEEKPYLPVANDQTIVSFLIYASRKQYPKYVTDEGCVKLGEIIIDIDRSVPLNKRIVLVSISFGGTEIEVRAKEKRTGRSTKATLSFLG